MRPGLLPKAHGRPASVRQTHSSSSRTRQPALAPCTQSTAASLRSSACRCRATQPRAQAAGHVGHNPVNLAFLGDGVWEVHVRSVLLTPPKKPVAYTLAVKEKVNAEFQAGLLQGLTSSWQLSEAEQQLVAWAAGYKNIQPPARLSGPGGAAIYAQATAFEALLGYLHLHDTCRLQAVLQAALPQQPAPEKGAEVH